MPANKPLMIRLTPEQHAIAVRIQTHYGLRTLAEAVRLALTVASRELPEQQKSEPSNAG